MKRTDSFFSPSLGLLVIRLMAGAVFAFHGSQKLFGLFGGHGISGTAGWMDSVGIPFPVASTVLAGSVELLGALALATGLGLRWLSPPLTLTMLVAAFSAHTGFAAQTGGMEYPLTLAALSLGLGLTGPGRYALSLPGSAPARSVEPALS